MEVNPETPAYLEVIGTTQHACILAWPSASVEQSYRLSRDGVAVYEGAELSYTDSGLESGSAHTYRITGCIGDAESDPAAIDVTTKTAVELITDRTELDVSAGRAKGQYNALDLIRVGEAVLYTQSILIGDAGFDVHAAVKLDWQLNEIPTQAQMQAYLENIKAIRSIVRAYRPTADAPLSMNGLTWRKANDIESILADAETMVRGIMLSNHRYSGRTVSGVCVLP